MPLNLYVYSRSWSDGSELQTPAYTIPYKRILITLLTILGPVAIGIFIKRKASKLAAVLAKVYNIAFIEGL